jgi:hypothetical protein
MLVSFFAAESAAHWLQGEGKDRGRDRGWLNAASLRALQNAHSKVPCSCIDVHWPIEMSVRNVDLDYIHSSTI